VGGGIRENHEVRLLDLRIEKREALQETIETFKPDIIGCSGCTIDVYNVKELLAEAKRLKPGILTVVGGHHATMMPTDYFEDYIDLIVTGEGAGTFRKICENHETQRSFETIENIYYRANGKMVFTRKADYPSLETLPLPARDLTAQYRHRYKILYISGTDPVAFALSSTGCVFRCKFCAIPRSVDFKLHTREIDKVVEELSAIEEKFIFWLDDEFLINPRRATLLASEIEKAGIKKKYWFYGRSDSIVHHPECIEAWARIGLHYVMIGLESHKDDDLERMQKSSSVAKNEEALRILKGLKVKVKGNFIVQPEFDKEDFKGLADYARRLDIDAPVFSILTPLPGTDLYDELKDRLITKNYNLYDLLHTVLPTKLPLKEFYKQYFCLFRRATSLKKKLKGLSALKQLNAKDRRAIFANMRKFIRRMKNAHKLYDQ
jgi:hopanoid C-3 methylase